MLYYLFFAAIVSWVGDLFLYNNTCFSSVLCVIVSQVNILCFVEMLYICFFWKDYLLLLLLNKKINGFFILYVRKFVPQGFEPRWPWLYSGKVQGHLEWKYDKGVALIPIFCDIEQGQIFMPYNIVYFQRFILHYCILLVMAWKFVRWR